MFRCEGGEFCRWKGGEGEVVDCCGWGMVRVGHDGAVGVKMCECGLIEMRIE